jgi:hypothetical protein
MAQPSIWGNALQDAFANPMTLGGLSLLSGGDLNSGIRSGAALQQQVQQQRQRDATQEAMKGLLADPNSQFSKLDAGSRGLLESNPDMAADVFMKRLSQQMDPMAGLDADYKRAQIGKMKAEAADAGSAYGKTGTVVQGSDGKFYSIQFGSRGQRQILPLELGGGQPSTQPQAGGASGSPASNVPPAVSLSPARGIEFQGDTGFDKATGRSVVNIATNLSNGEFAKNSGKQGAEAIYGKPREDALAAQRTLQNMDVAQQYLDKGLITGKGANLISSAKGWMDTLGIGGRDSRERLANTQAFAAQMGREVGNVIRLFGSGTGLSDGDRAYAQAIAGGNIELTADALRKITDINRRLALAQLKNYNGMVDDVDPRLSPFPLHIYGPGEKPAAAAPQAPAPSDWRSTFKRID